MSTLSKEQCKSEIQIVHDKVKELTGLEMTVFRPPFGDYDDIVIEAANELGYHVIQWDVDASHILFDENSMGRTRRFKNSSMFIFNLIRISSL